jgi:hypothetical protein
MSTDRTRPPDDRRQGYRGVSFQQGRVVIDRDLNAAQEFLSAAHQDAAADFVGPVGTPGDDDFRVTVPSSLAHDGFDVHVHSGVMYVGGLRLEFAAPGKGKSLSYASQPEWLDPPPVSYTAFPAREVVALRATLGEVGAVEDVDQLDPGLGGPDTAARVWVRTRVVREKVKADTCEGATAELEKRWLGDGYTYDPAKATLLPRGTLQVEFASAGGTAGPCDPEPTGAFLHADNQHIRVKRLGDDILWGYDNASFLYKVKSVESLTSVTLASAPVDETRRPRKGWFVEVLSAAAELRNGAFAAEPNGHVTALDADALGGVLTLSNPMPAAYKTNFEAATKKWPLYVRVWESRHAIPASGVVPLVAADSSATGLQLTLGSDGPGEGEFWSFAVRPGVDAERQILPARFKTPQQPDGPRQWLCPLALVEWTAAGKGAVLHDCRQHFDDLVELTARKFEGGGGCCEITVTAEQAPTGELWKFIREAVNRAGRPVRVCFKPGRYALDAPLVLTKEFAGVTLHGCGAVTLGASEKAPAGTFLDGLIVVAGCERVTISGIHFSPPGLAALSQFKARGVPPPVLDTLKNTEGDFRTAVAVRAASAPHLRVEDCTFAFPASTDSGVFAPGVFAHGNCTGFRLLNCRWDEPRKGGTVADPNAGQLKAASQTNLKLLGSAIHSYFSTMNKFAPTLGDLIPYVTEARVPDVRVFIHPSRRKEQPPNLDERRLRQWVNENTDYAYLPPKATQNFEHVLAHEKPLPGMTKVNVLRGDGSVVYYPFDAASKLIVAAGGAALGQPASEPNRGWFGALLWPMVETYGNADKPKKYALKPVLDRAEVGGNEFVGTTLGVFALGSLGDISIRGNRASDCPGAIWLMPPANAELADTNVETRFGRRVADAFPPLAEKFDSTGADLVDGTVRIADNHFDTRPGGGLSSTLAVFVAGHPPYVEAFTGINPTPTVFAFGQDRQTVMLSGNHVTTAAWSVATLRIYHVNAVTVTGNVIANRPDGPSKGLEAMRIDSLLSPGKTPGDRVTITGNVFTGEVNWDDLGRSTFPPWRNLNSET